MATLKRITVLVAMLAVLLVGSVAACSSSSASSSPHRPATSSSSSLSTATSDVGLLAKAGYVNGKHGVQVDSGAANYGNGATASLPDGSQVSCSVYPSPAALAAAVRFEENGGLVTGMQYVHGANWQCFQNADTPGIVDLPALARADGGTLATFN